MGRELILLTGATGFIGFRVLLRALEAGYAVRCVIDGPDDLRRILTAPGFKALNVKDNQLFWTMILDMTAPGAFRDALKGVKYVLHCASAPANHNDLDGTSPAYDPHAALKGVANLLEAAHTATRCKLNFFNTLKRIVVTTSIADLAVVDDDAPYDLSEDDVDGNNGARPDIGCRGMSAPGLAAPSRPGSSPFPAGKTSTLNVSKAWVVKHRPAFSVVFFLPTWVLGYHDLATSTSALERGPNGPLVRLLKGKSSQPPLEHGFVSVRDVADAHVAVLQDGGPSGHGAFVLSSEVAWRHAQSLIRKAFPQAFEDGVFRIGGRHSEGQGQDDEGDYDEDMRVLGIKGRSFEETAVEVARQYLDVDGQLLGRPGDE